jgi:hypothetical protein
MQEHADDFSWGADTLASGQDASLLLSGVEEGSARRSQSPVPPQLTAEGGFLGSLLSCFSIDQLKPYFDVNDADIYERYACKIYQLCSPERTLQMQAKVMMQLLHKDMQGLSLYEPYASPTFSSSLLQSSACAEAEADAFPSSRRAAARPVWPCLGQH